jgi:hypothetical protein
MSRGALKFLISDFKFRIALQFGISNLKSEIRNLEFEISAKRREASV